MTDTTACDAPRLFWTRLTQEICAGRNLVTALAATQDELEGTPLAAVATGVRQDVESGMNLTDALKRHPQVFGKHVLCLVEGGERTGILDRVLLLILEHAWRCPLCILAAPPTRQNAK